MLTWSLGAAAAATSRGLRTRREGREETLDGEVASRGLGSSLGIEDQEAVRAGRPANGDLPATSPPQLAAV